MLHLCSLSWVRSDLLSDPIGLQHWCARRSIASNLSSYTADACSKPLSPCVKLSIDELLRACAGTHLAQSLRRPL